MADRRRDSGQGRNSGGLSEDSLETWDAFGQFVTPLKGDKRKSAKAPARPLAKVSRDWLDDRGAAEREDEDTASRAAGPGPHSGGTGKRASGGAEIATLDLHGKTREEARTRLEEYLTNERNRGTTRVRVITGKGKHSAGAPVLPKDVPDWLGKGKMRKVVDHSVPERDKTGGIGAYMVYLKAPAGPPGKRGG